MGSQALMLCALYSSSQARQLIVSKLRRRLGQIPLQNISDKYIKDLLATYEIGNTMYYSILDMWTGDVMDRYHSRCCLKWSLREVH